jgi:hypothetical protein
MALIDLKSNLASFDFNFQRFMEGSRNKSKMREYIVLTVK